MALKTFGLDETLTSGFGQRRKFSIRGEWLSGRARVSLYHEPGDDFVPIEVDIPEEGNSVEGFLISSEDFKVLQKTRPKSLA